MNLRKRLSEIDREVSRFGALVARILFGLEVPMVGASGPELIRPLPLPNRRK